MREGSSLNCRRLILGVLAIFICAAGLFAQSPAPPAGAEARRLGYFVGKWNGDCEIKASGSTPSIKFAEAADSDWIPGGVFVVMHWTEQMPSGDGTTLMILGYDAARKVYTFNTFQGTGETASAKGSVSGDTWTFYGDSVADGKATKSRFSMKEISPTVCATKLEVSADGAKWTTVMEGRVTKGK